MSILKKRYVAVLAAAVVLSGCVGSGNDANQYSSQGYGDFYAEPLCQFTVFEGKTFDKRNKIKVCMKSRLGWNYMEFHFDTLGELAQRSLSVKAKEVVWEHAVTKNKAYDKIIVSENNTGMAVMRTIEGGIASGKLIVTFDGKEKTYIIDPNSMTMKTTFKGHSLIDFDVVPSMSNTDRVALGRALAPEW